MPDFGKLINSEVPVLVDFYAEWCGPCKTMAPILVDLSRELGGRAKIVKVDIDRNPAAADRYGIRSVPTLVLFRKGEIKWKQSGVMPASELRKVIERFS